jgi:hypothetical protein
VTTPTQIVPAEPSPRIKKPARKKSQISARQLRGVEHPATVLLHPVIMGEHLRWWAHENSGMLIGGVEVNSTGDFRDSENARLCYLPTPVPRSWEERDFNLVIEYECEHEKARFAFIVHYGCGDPSELHVGSSKLQRGKLGGKQRLAFALDRHFIVRNELFRATIEVHRESPHPVLIYGAWLEIGVD